MSGESSELSSELNLKSMTMNMVNKSPSGIVKVSDFQATSERTISDILMQETLLDSFTVESTTEVGTVLAKFRVSPTDMHPSDSESRVSYMARMFRFWRGKISLNLIFTKTILQQMKIAVVFVPGATFSDSAPTKSQLMMFSHKRIINPANEAEVEFIIPYVDSRPFLPIGESTGVVYFILYQPFTTSVDPGSAVSVDIFVRSNNLELHEFGVIPSNNGFQSLPNDLLFLYAEDTGETYNGSAMGAYTFQTDSGAIVGSNNVDVVDPFTGYTVGRVVGFVDIEPALAQYDPSLHRTIQGIPGPIVYKRICFTLRTQGATSNLVPYTLYWGPTGVYMGTAITTLLFFGVPENFSLVSRNLLPYFTFATNDELYLAKAEIADLREAVLRMSALLCENRGSDCECTASELCSACSVPKKWKKDGRRFRLPSSSSESGEDVPDTDPSVFERRREEILNLREERDPSGVVRRRACQNKLYSCELHCLVCNCTYNDWYGPDCECDQHYCENNPPPKTRIFELSFDMIEKWMNYCLEVEFAGFPVFVPSNEVFDAFQQAIFGEFNDNSAAIFTGPTALLGVYYDGCDRNIDRFIRVVESRLNSWTPVVVDHLPFYLARMWYLRYRCSNSGLDMRRLDDLIRTDIRRVACKYLSDERKTLLHVSTSAEKIVSRSEWLTMIAFSQFP